ncbi:MAG: hypothetical protein IPF41_05345 [Flavobacteriales bacterium]|nr:hypothetical protein [Flavobacteriales bacterium]
MAIRTAELNAYGVNNANSGAIRCGGSRPSSGYSFKALPEPQHEQRTAPGDTRACHFRINGWAGNQLQEDQFYNVKVRGRVNGDYNI